MSYGLRIENPSGTLVLDSNAIHYRFHSKPNPYALGSYYYYQQGSSLPAYLNAATYRVTLASSSLPPVVFIKPEEGKVSMVEHITNVGGTTWEIAIYCVDISGGLSEDMRGTPVATPTIYVFAPMSSSGDTFGLQLLNSSGQVSFDSGYKPLWIRGSVSFPYRDGAWNSGAMSWVAGSATQFNGDAQAVSGASTLMVMGSTLSMAEATIAVLGEPADTWGYGWSLQSGSLARRRFWIASNRQGHVFDWGTDDVNYTLRACTAVIARTTDYD